jgi:hypothetical protein
MGGLAGNHYWLTEVRGGAPRRHGSEVLVELRGLEPLTF